MSKKIGRPKLAKSEARGRFISTRLSPPEYAAIVRAVKRSGKAKTEWVRDALAGAADNRVLVMPMLRQEYTPAAYPALAKFIEAHKAIPVQGGFVLRSEAGLKQLWETITEMLYAQDGLAVFGLTGYAVGQVGQAFLLM